MDRTPGGRPETRAGQEHFLFPHVQKEGAGPSGPKNPAFLMGV